MPQQTTEDFTDDLEEGEIDTTNPLLRTERPQDHHHLRHHYKEEYDNGENNNRSKVYWCDPKALTYINIITIVTIIIIISCIIVLFFIDEAQRNFVYGIITMFICLLIAIICCNKSHKNQVHPHHVVNNFYGDHRHHTLPT